MLDFVHARALRQSILVPQGAAAGARLDAARATSLHFSATMAMMQAQAAGRPPEGDVAARLAERFPATVPFGELARADGWNNPQRTAERAFALCVEGLADLHVAPLAIATRPSVRPRASAVARWQSTRRPFVANLRHVGVRLADDAARALLPLCDGTRDVDALLAGIAPTIPAAEADDPRMAVQRRLAYFASAALFEA
jgi:hypothetical protein